MNVAVIDLGTNTCNLLIANIQNGNFEILHQSKQLVKLGDDKIKKNQISTDAVERILRSLRIFQDIIKTHHAEKIKVVATSAIREAENKIEVLEQVGRQTGWVAKIVSGQKEARLIFEGVLLALGEINRPAVVLDIGGGSNELILANNSAIDWIESKPTGMVRVINEFALSDPMTKEELKILQQFFLARHATAITRCIKSGTKILIGCSGAFDTIADIIDKVEPGEKRRKKQNISIAEFNEVYNTIIQSNHNERLKIKGMDMVRVDLIVPAVVFIQQLIYEIGIESIIQTDFALREGVLYEMMK